MTRNKSTLPIQEYLKKEGPGYPFVLSSRARLARNLDGVPFPQAANEENLEIARGMVLEAVAEAVSPQREWSMFFGEELSRDELEMMTEERLISRGFAEQPRGKALAVYFGAGEGIVVNDEDHARIQAVLPGAQFMKALENADKIDGKLESEVQYWYDHKLGYLTSCPTNVGTGLRVSALLHLPALSITGEIAKTIAALGARGIFVRGIYGEGTGVAGNIFQLSNRKTLGVKEEEIASTIDAVVKLVVEKEKTSRKVILREQFIETADRVSRALGVIERAKRMFFFEALELISLVKLGIELELLHIKDFNILHVGAAISPYHIRRELEKDTSDEDVNTKRAPILRRMLDL
ncbi:MAG: hypothetical protein PHP64_06245 [Actinomycetota bacterium]|nr:hypothetical protein [Actinomycetota bacterium]